MTMGPKILLKTSVLNKNVGRICYHKTMVENSQMCHKLNLLEPNAEYSLNILLVRDLNLARWFLPPAKKSSIKNTTVFNFHLIKLSQINLLFTYFFLFGWKGVLPSGRWSIRSRFGKWGRWASSEFPRQRRGCWQGAGKTKCW